MLMTRDGLTMEHQIQHGHGHGQNLNQMMIDQNQLIKIPEFEIPFLLRLDQNCQISKNGIRTMKDSVKNHLNEQKTNDCLNMNMSNYKTIQQMELDMDMIQSSTITSTTKPQNLFLPSLTNFVNLCPERESTSEYSSVEQNKQTFKTKENKIHHRSELQIEVNNKNIKPTNALVDKTTLFSNSVEKFHKPKNMTSLDKNDLLVSVKELCNYNFDENDQNLQIKINNMSEIINESNFCDVQNNYNTFNFGIENSLNKSIYNFDEDVFSLKSSLEPNVPSSPLFLDLNDEEDWNLNLELNDVLDNNLTKRSNNIESEFIHQQNESNLTSTSSLVKDEDYTVYDCVDPKKVLSFSSDIFNLPIVSSLQPTEDSYNLKFSNPRIENTFEFTEAKSTTFQNLHETSKQLSNSNKKNDKKLVLKIPSSNIDEIINNNIKNIVETPDVIKIVESLQDDKEKENLLPMEDFIEADISSPVTDNSQDISNAFTPDIDVTSDTIETSEMNAMLENNLECLFNSKSNSENLSSITSNKQINFSNSSCESITSSNFDESTYTACLYSPPLTPLSQSSSCACSSGIGELNFNNIQKTKPKRTRGRPPVDHSSPPTIEQLKNADPSKRKYLEQRYKNNEASRISRRNKKRKEEEQKLEEIYEINKNQILRRRHMKLTRKHEFLKEYLRNIIQLS